MKIKNTVIAMPIESLEHLPRKNSFLLNASLAGVVLCSATVAIQAVASPQDLNKPVYTLKIVSHGEDANRFDNMNEVNRQRNRRTDIHLNTRVQAGYKTLQKIVDEKVRVKVRDAVKRSVHLKDGGVIWVTQDPASIKPTLNVTASSSVAMRNGMFASALNFTIKTNYAYFIDSWELAIYPDNSDRNKPLALFMGRDLANDHKVKWNGKTLSGKRLNVGDKLHYVLTVRDKSGHSDATHLHEINLTGAEHLYNNGAKSQSRTKSAENDLARQTIPVHGSRVRIFGSDIAKDNKIKVNGETINLISGKFVIEKLLPEGLHRFDIAITDNANQTYHKPLNVKLKGKYMFMVALADVTIGEGKVTGNMESLGDGDKHLGGDIFVDGRVAFYIKGKIQGKYLVTAQMDTGTEPVEDLFDNILKKDPSSLFRRLDPDKYYPVYGDDSTTIDDTNSQGKIYVRVDWDKSRAIWGNYNTAMTGTELSRFNRSLYGAKINYKSPEVTKDGEHNTDVTVFASEAQSAFRHNQFLGTGGSLYYLKDNDIVKGSEKIWIEVRQGGSERAIKKVMMEEGRDYEIDDFQGRIILHRPLLQIVEKNSPSLVKDTPLDGNQLYLMVDYEYVPDNFDGGKAAYGSRGKVWINDHFAVGGTYIHENRNENDYELKGVDVTVQKAKGTYLKAEYAKSNSNQTRGSFLSDDGGLNFTAFNDNIAAKNIDGSAYSLEARANFNEFTGIDGSIGAWFKNRDAGFSSSNFNNGVDTIDTGLEAIIKASDELKVSLRSTLLDKKDQKKTTTASAQADYEVNDKFSVAGELRYIEEDDQTAANKDGKGVLGALKGGYDVSDELNLYAIAQGTIEKSGAYTDNNLLTIGTKAKVSNKLDINGELSTGDRGDAARIGLNYRLTNAYRVYTNYTQSTDRTDNKRSTITVGQKSTVTDQLKVYTEHQFTHESKQSGVGHTFGLDYKINKEISTNASVQVARLDKEMGGLTDRDAFSVGLNYIKDKTNASTKLEYRKDKSDTVQTDQWVTTNRLNYRLNPSLRLQGKFNYSETKDKLGNTKDAQFTEAAIGFAFRPVSNDRLNVLGRLTYLYDLRPLSQSKASDEKSLVASLESSYQIDQKWEVGGKLAHKQGEIRENRNIGNWNKNDATLAAARVRYHMTNKWDAMGEYHWMKSDESQDSRQGVMLSFDRHVGENMKVGIGYNFTNFTDDLSGTDGTAEGWFVNLVGKY